MNIPPNPLERARANGRGMAGMLHHIVSPARTATRLYTVARGAGAWADILSRHGLHDLAARVRAWRQEALSISAAITEWNIKRRRM